MTPHPERECPRYERCSVNRCPLSVGKYKPHQGDKYRKCTMERGVRERIGEKYPNVLPLRGLTVKEHQGSQRWAALPLEKQLLVMDAGKTALSILRRETKDKMKVKGQQLASKRRL